MRPGVEITTQAARGTRGEPTDTGVAFVTGMSDAGPIDRAIKVTNLQEFVDTYGDRVAFGYLYDWLDTFFAEGGAEAYVSRVVGPAPVRALLTLADRAGAPINTLRVHALYVGDYANGADTGGLAVEVQNGTDADTFRLVITQRQADGTYVEVERFDNLNMNAASENYALTVVGSLAAPHDGNSDYVLLEDLASATAAPNDNPAVAARANLAGGDDDHVDAVDAQWAAALALFLADYGPGQVAAPGRITTAGQTQLLAHAAANNRTALVDAGNGANKAALLAIATALDEVPGADTAGVFGGHVVIPGLSSGSTRQVPASAFAAGLTARLDAERGAAGFAPAGAQGQARYALDVVLPAGGLTDDDYEDLNDAGVNMVRAFRTRGVQLYGFRSVTSDPDWVQLTSHRERMSLVARLNEVALGYVFRTIDGRGQLFGELNGALVGQCMRDYTAGVLYGSTPEEAFRVDTGDTVNTEETIAAGEIRADVYARFSPFAELVRLSITKVAVTGRV